MLNRIRRKIATDPVAFFHGAQALLGLMIVAILIVQSLNVGILHWRLTEIKGMVIELQETIGNE